jgi:hypothetical protein
MSFLTPARAGALAALAALAAGLGGCGKTGELQRPAPLFGQPRPAPAAVNGQGGQDPTRPVRTIDPRDELDNVAPPRTSPIAGQSPDPTRPGPQGSLPDPYSNPR